MAKKETISIDRLGEIISETLEGLHDDSIGTDKSNAVSSLAGKALKRYVVKMDYQRHMGRRRPIKCLEDAE